MIAGFAIRGPVGCGLFQRQLAEASGEVGGTALSSIQAYLTGTVAPSLAFVERAAEILGVRAAWLAFNAGFPTDHEQQEIEALARRQVTVPTEVVQAVAGARGTREKWEEALREALTARLPVFWKLLPAGRRVLMEGLTR